MKELSFYLQKFKNTGFKEAEVKTVVVETLHELIRADIQKSDVSFNTTTRCVRISAHPVIKNELHMHREKILAEIERRMGAFVKKLQ